MKTIDYRQIDSSWNDRILEELGAKVTRHLHFDDGFTLIAAQDGKLIGVIACFWHQLPEPFSSSLESYVDIIEVVEGFRRHGVASELLKIAALKSLEEGAYQIRAWSSDDKIEALKMWRALGYGLVPAASYPGGKEVRGMYAVKVLR